ncbi:MAG: pyruvate kinase [Phycisphaerales bacterium]|nr:MAG: pyruvate kinase [Phycisphaerales bacterium]
MPAMNGTARPIPSAPPLTKIIATLGPASSTEDTIGDLIRAGVSVFRLNFSHGRLEEHQRILKLVRKVAAALGQSTAVLGDLQGPKIRVGEVAEPGVELAEGATVVFQREPIVARPAADGGVQRFSATCEEVIDDPESGQRLLINDGAVRLLIIAKTDDELTCTVTHGGLVTSGKGINLPDTDLSLGPLGERDWRHVRWAIENDLDFLALSFVRSDDDVRELAAGIQRIAAELERSSFRLPIIAKIEIRKALEEIESIVEQADAVMVARGDLGVEMDLAQVPVIQKRLMAIASDFGKPCIVATQMLQSMITEPVPTRAEANDVAGAMFDRADAVMLSGETAVGKYPVLAVHNITRIARFTEAYLATLPADPSPPERLIASRYHGPGLAHGVWTICQDITAKCVVVWSQGGDGARYLSQNNFLVPIVAVTSDERIARQMQLLRGVIPLRMDPPPTFDEFEAAIDEHLRHAHGIKNGESCLIVAGEPLGAVGVADHIMIHAVGERPNDGRAEKYE